jgi:hypothetical protein
MLYFGYPLGIRGCGRATRFNPFSETLLPLDTKRPESELNQVVPSSTPNGRTRTLHILHPGSNNEYKLTILSPFHTT